MEIQELRILDCLLAEKNWDIFEENNIQDSDLQSTKGKIALKFIRQYIGEFGDFPPKDVVSQENNLIFPETAPREYAVKNYKKFLQGTQAKKLIERARDALNKKADPPLAISIMKEANNIHSNEKVASYLESGEARIKDVKDTAVHGLSGAEPPWKSLKDAIEVWEDSTFNVLAGVSGTGKTWLACFISKFIAFTLNKKVLLVSPENSKESVSRRLDSLKYKIPYSDRRKGHIDMRLWNEFKDNVRSDMANEDIDGDIFIADSSMVKNVADIENIIATRKIDFVMVDGSYLLRPSEDSRDKLQASSLLIQNYRNAAVNTGLPWVCVTQFNPITTDMGDSREAGFQTRGNKDWNVNAATLFGVVQSTEDLILNRLKIIICKIRESGAEEVDSTFYINSDKVNMDFSEIEEDYVNEDILNATLG